MTSRTTHVLVLPSEEFQPPESHLAGIFQLHQCRVLLDAGFTVGVVSVKQEFSIPMLIKESLFRLLKRPARKALEGYGVLGLIGLLKDKIWHLDRFVSHELVEGIPTVRISGFYFGKPSPAKNHTGWVAAGKKAFESYVDKHGKPDLLHAHNCDPAGILAADLSSRFNIPFVMTEHSSYFHRQLIPQTLMPKLRHAFASAAVVGVVSPRLGQDLHKHAGLSLQKTQWMPNVIDPDFAAVPLAESREKSAGFEFLSVGDLIPLKGHKELISAFASTFRGQEAILKIAGDGPQMESLDQHISEHGVEDQVTLLGRLGRTEVRDAIDECDCLVLPSHYETFGVVLIEAMVRGKPVVASDCGGPSCVVNSENGVLVPPQDVRALGEALLKMRQSYSQFSSTRIRQDVIERFGHHRLVSDLTTAYDAALGMDV